MLRNSEMRRCGSHMMRRGTVEGTKCNMKRSAIQSYSPEIAFGSVITLRHHHNAARVQANAQMLEDM